LYFLLLDWWTVRVHTNAQQEEDMKRFKLPIRRGISGAALAGMLLRGIAMQATAVQARAPQKHSSVTVIASHLNNPRNLTWGPATS
jgi:hypothetical protein